jgi:hypothetical protein
MACGGALEGPNPPRPPFSRLGKGAAQHAGLAPFLGFNQPSCVLRVRGTRSCYLEERKTASAISVEMLAFSPQRGAAGPPAARRGLLPAPHTNRSSQSSQSIAPRAAVVGIDLGTTNSLIATFKDGKAQVVQDALGNDSTPSVVSYSAVSDSQQLPPLDPPDLRRACGRATPELLPEASSCARARRMAPCWWATQPWPQGAPGRRTPSTRSSG